MFPQENLKVVSMQLQQVLDKLSAEAMRETGACQRDRVLDGATLVQTLVLGYLQEPKATIEQLAQMAGFLGKPVSAQAVDQRRTQETAEGLKLLIEQAAQHRIEATGDCQWLNQFTSVEFLDSTTLTLPDALKKLWLGCSSTAGKTAAFKIQTRLDYKNGGLKLELRPGRENDHKSSLQTADIQAGSLHVRDLGYFDLDVLRTLQECQAYFVSRLQDETALFTPDGQSLDLLELLQSSQHSVVDMPILLGKKWKLPCRLLAFRLPAEIADRRRQKLHAKGRKKGYTPKDKTLQLRGWSIYITNASQQQLSPEQVQAANRLRWQLELVFKLWKTHGGLDFTRSQDPWKVLCEVYAKLLGLLLQHWILVATCWDRADRSLPKGAQVLRKWIIELARSLANCQRLMAALAELRTIMQKNARTNRRRKKPAAFQLVEDAEKNGYQKVRA
jgi:hypothetical protein